MRHLQRHPIRQHAWMVGAFLCALALVFFLAACSSDTASPGGVTTSLPTKNCGSLTTNYAGLLQAEKVTAKQDETCFFQAYQQCHPATLTYETIGVDAGAINHLSVKSSNGSCSLTNGVQHFIAPNPPGAAITYTCASAQLLADALHITSCGAAGEVVIPGK